MQISQHLPDSKKQHESNTGRLRGEEGRPDLDAAHAVGEGGVEGEDIRLVDGLVIGLLGQDAVLAAGDGVEDADDVLVWQVHALLHLLQRQPLICAHQ